MVRSIHGNRGKEKRVRVVGSVKDKDAWERICADENICKLCDIVELHIDGFPEDFPVEDIVPRGYKHRLLVTARHKDEGGMRYMSDEEREQKVWKLLTSAYAIDWEIAHLSKIPNIIKEAKKLGVKIIASAHDFSKTPSIEYMLTKEEEARALGADIVKFAYKVCSVDDFMVGVDLLKRATGSVTVMGMGELGAVSRLLYAQHGACLVYGYLGDTPTAPGQWSAALCRQSLDALGL